jgi:hypothetical protein
MNFEVRGRIAAVTSDDDEIIDAEIVDEEPKRCPECESYDVGRAKHFWAYVALMFAAIGAAVAVEQSALAVLIIAGLLVLYYVMPPFRCHACGARFD